MVWETFALSKQIDIDVMSVVFEECKFFKTIKVYEEKFLNFNVTINTSGYFEMIHNNSVTGKLSTENYNNEVLWYPKMENYPKVKLEDMILNQKDIYKELHIRNYNFR